MRRRRITHTQRRRITSLEEGLSTGLAAATASAAAFMVDSDSTAEKTMNEE